MWREAVVAYCEVLSRDVSGGTEEDDDKPLKTRFELRIKRIR